VSSTYLAKSTQALEEEQAEGAGTERDWEFGNSGSCARVACHRVVVVKVNRGMKLFPPETLKRIEKQATSA